MPCVKLLGWYNIIEMSRQGSYHRKGGTDCYFPPEAVEWHWKSNGLLSTLCRREGRTDPC